MTDQLTLNYVEIEDVANRTFLRENFNRTERTAYKIPFDQIKIREGFNKRLVYSEIEALAISIKTHGLKEPLTVDVLSDGTIYIEKGHRRLKAFQLLVEQGESIDTVDCYVNDSKVTEELRMLNQYTSNNLQEKLLPLEQAEVAKTLKYSFGIEKSNDEVATLLGCSRQKVDNLIILSSANDVIKNQIITQNLSTKDALSLIANEKKLKRMADNDEVKANKISMFKTADPFDPNADELASLKELEEKTIVPGEDDLPWVEVGESEENDEAIRVTSNVEHTKSENGKSLELVGNLAGEKNNDKKEYKSEGVKYDSDRPEIAQIQNLIKLIDKADVIAEKIPDKQTAKDLTDIMKWMRNDAMPLRDWIHSNKKQNKTR